VNTKEDQEADEKFWPFLGVGLGLQYD